MWPFKKKCTVAQAARIYAKIVAASAREDRLLDEWMAGPGKDYPTETQMMCDIEGAEPKPWQTYKDGWIEAFHDWAKTQP